MRVKRWMPVAGLLVGLAAAACSGSGDAVTVEAPPTPTLTESFEAAQGFALGMMVGAMTLGSGSTHLLRSIFVDNWEAAIIGSSILAVIGGLMLPLLVSDGPHDTKGAKFNPRYLLVLFTNRGLRLTLVGYLGHMWELYALWAWVGAFMLAVVGPRPLIGDGLGLAALVAFLVFVAGAVGSVVAGLGSDRYGRTLATIVPMVISGSIAFFIGFIPFEMTVLIVLISMVWGAAVIADSAQFSTAVTELAELECRGTILTFQTGQGFALTVMSIRLVPWLVDGPGWGGGLRCAEHRSRHRHSGHAAPAVAAGSKATGRGPTLGVLAAKLR